MQSYYIGMIQFFHRIDFLQSNQLIILSTVINFSNSKEFWLSVFDFSQVRVIASADIVHEVVLLEDGGCFCWYKLPSF